MLVAAALVLHEAGTEAPPAASRDADTASSPARTGAAGANELVIRADANGHFLVNASVGLREIAFLVDTGATMVALSPQDAETLGFYVHQLEYRGRAETAGGKTRFAPVTIDEIAIGDIVVRDVPAAVLETPMHRSLLGMTFLRRLAGFEVKGDRLILRW